LVGVIGNALAYAQVVVNGTAGGLGCFWRAGDDVDAREAENAHRMGWVDDQCVAQCEEGDGESEKRAGEEHSRRVNIG